MVKLAVLEGRGNNQAYWLYVDEYSKEKVGIAYTTKKEALRHSDEIRNLDRTTVDGLYPAYIRL